MDDLISRKELRKAFKESGYFTNAWLHWARLLIDQAPTVLHDNYSMGYQDGVKKVLSERPQGEWNILQKDDTGIHKIECPFCKYSKGGEFANFIFTFDEFPYFCESCGAEMRGN